MLFEYRVIIEVRGEIMRWHTIFLRIRLSAPPQKLDVRLAAHVFQTPAQAKKNVRV